MSKKKLGKKQEPVAEIDQLLKNAFKEK